MNSKMTVNNLVLDPKEIKSLEWIKKAVDRFKPRIAVACSFGKDSIVTLHLARKIWRDIPIFAILTPFKPPETFQFKDRLIKEWGIDIKVYMSDEKVDPYLYKTDPDECCRILKVEPTKRAVQNLDCWITGLRNTEGRTRVDYKEWEDKGGLVKLNPILTWTEADIWRYTATHGLPVHPWYALGYRSLGCAPCSSIGGVSERDGRWIGTSKCGGECGIHTKRLKEAPLVGQPQKDHR